MPTNITTDDILDLRDLADLAREQGDILEDEEADADEKADATATVKALASMLGDLGYHVGEDAEAVADELQRIGDGYECTLVADTYFETYAQNLCEEFGYIKSDLPDFIKDNINWSGVADDLKEDYIECALDGVDYLIRSF